MREIGTPLGQQAQRLLGDYLGKIEHCLGLLDEGRV